MSPLLVVESLAKAKVGQERRTCVVIKEISWWQKSRDLWLKEWTTI